MYKVERDTEREDQPEISLVRFPLSVSARDPEKDQAPVQVPVLAPARLQSGQHSEHSYKLLYFLPDQDPGSG